MCEEGTDLPYSLCNERTSLENTLETLHMIKQSAVNSCVSYYSKKFDRVFNELTAVDDQTIKQEMCEKLAKIKDEHMREYSSMIEKQLSEQLDQFIACEQIVSQLKSIESNDLINDDLVDVRKAVLPIKTDYMNELRDIEQKESEKYVTQLSEYDNIKKCFDDRHNKYEEIRKLLYKKIVSIINELEDIDLEELDSLF